MYMKNAVVTTLRKNSRQNSENYLLEFRKWRENCAFSKWNYFSSISSSELAQWNFGKPAVTLLPRIRKAFPNPKIVENTIFWRKLFFFQKCFFSNGECNFDNHTKKIPPKYPQICCSDSKKWRENIWIFRKKIIFAQIVLLYM